MVLRVKGREPGKEREREEGGEGECMNQGRAAILDYSVTHVATYMIVCVRAPQ